MYQHFTSPEESSISNQLYDMLQLSRGIDAQIFSQAHKILQKKEKFQNCYQFFCSKEFYQHFQNFNRQKKQESLENDKNKLIQLLKALIMHDFNKSNYSLAICAGVRKQLICKISKDFNIIEWLKFIVHLSAVDETFIQSSSNSINLLVEMRVNLSEQCWQNIKIQNTSIAGGNFSKSNLSGSEFNNVRIDRVNLNQAQLFLCKWKNIIVNELYELYWQKGSIRQVGFSPDGMTFASADDHSIVLWDFKTGRQKIQLKIKGQIKSLHISPGNCNAILASGDDNGLIHLWQFSQGKKIAKLKASNDRVYSLCFSPDGTTLASANLDKSIRLWNVSTWKLKSELNGLFGQISSICFSADGTTLAFGDHKKSIHLWNLTTGKLEFILNGHDKLVISICFSSNGFLASCGGDKSIRLWNVSTGQLKSQLNGHFGWITSICFSPDGCTLASGSNDKQICIWDATTGELKSILNGHNSYVNSICFSPDGITLVSGSDDKSTRLWDVSVRELKQQQNGHSLEVTSVCFSPDGATASKDKLILLWNMSTTKLLSELNGHCNCVTSICFSSDGSMLASGSKDKSINLWNVSTGELIKKLNGHIDEHLAGKLQQKIKGHNGSVTSVCFFQQGCMLASGSKDRSIIFWVVKKIIPKYYSFMIPGCCKEIFYEDELIRSISFSPDGTTLAMSLNKSIGLMDVETAKLKFQLKGHIDYITSVCFSPDGTMLASCSLDKSIRLWDVSTGELKSELKGHFGKVRSVCFSPDGRILASASNDKSIGIWDVSIPKQFNFFPSVFEKSILNPIIVPILISQKSLFQAIGAQVFKGEFSNYQGINLKSLLFSKRASFLSFSAAY